MKTTITKSVQDKINYLQVLIVSIGLGLGFDLVSFLPEYITINPQIITIGFRAIYFFLCLIVLYKNNQRESVSKSYLPIIIFFIFYIVRSIFDSFFYYKSIYFFLLEFWIFIVMLILIPMASFSCKINYNTISKAKLYSLYLALLTNILGLANNNLKLEGEFKGGRLTGNVLMNPVTYGQMGVILIAISLTYLIKSNLFNKIKYLAFILLGVFNIALAGSRGPLIELSIILLVFLFYNFKKFNKLYFIIFLLSLYYLYSIYSQYFIYFDTALSRLESSGQEERNVLFTDAIDKIIHYPILGYQAIGSYPHNLIIESLMALGFLGGIIMLYIYFQSIRCILILVSNDNTSWLALVFLMYTVSSFISGSIYNSIEFWALFSFSLLLCKQKMMEIAK